MNWRRVLTWKVVPEPLKVGQKVKVVDSTYYPGNDTRSFIGKTGIVETIGTYENEPYVQVRFLAKDVFGYVSHWNYAPTDLEVVA